MNHANLLARAAQKPLTKVSPDQCACAAVTMPVGSLLVCIDGMEHGPFECRACAA